MKYYERNGGIIEGFPYCQDQEI